MRGELNEKEIIRRKIQLKSQALKLIRKEREQLKHLQNLLRLRDFLAAQMEEKFDALLSQKLDAVQYLIEALNPKIIIPGGLNELD